MSKKKWFAVIVVGAAMAFVTKAEWENIKAGYGELKRRAT